MSVVHSENLLPAIGVDLFIYLYIFIALVIAGLDFGQSDQKRPLNDNARVLLLPLCQLGI